MDDFVTVLNALGLFEMFERREEKNLGDTFGEISSFERYDFVRVRGRTNHDFDDIVMLV